MKSSALVHCLVAGLLLMSGAVGCKNRPKNPTPVPSAAVRVSPTDGRYGPGDVPIPDDGEVGTRPADGLYEGPKDFPGPDTQEDRLTFQAYTVYFAFDQSSIRTSERSKIEAVADHLRGNASHRVKIEGHCDERGTEGYNLALGDRRAQSIREYLVNLGLDSQRIYTISYGESRPAAEGHNEDAWAKNRRGEFILLRP